MLALERTTHLLTFGIFVCVNIGLRAAANDEAKVITFSSKDDTAICLYTETEKRCPEIEETLHKSDKSKQFDLQFLNFTDKSCSQQIIPLIQKIEFDWLCLVSGTNETEIVPNSQVLFSCTSGIISDSCEQQQILPNALCDQDILENVSLECYEISLTESSEAVCTRAFRVDECHNFVETTLMGKEGLLAFLLRSPMEVAACACAVFIVVTFFIALCIPEHKCRPTYSDNSHNTVPYRIYVRIQLTTHTAKIGAVYAGDRCAYSYQRIQLLAQIGAVCGGGLINAAYVVWLTVPQAVASRYRCRRLARYHPTVASRDHPAAAWFRRRQCSVMQVWGCQAEDIWRTWEERTYQFRHD